MRKHPNARKSDSSVLQPPRRQGFYSCPSSVESRHPCQSVIPTMISCQLSVVGNQLSVRPVLVIRFRKETLGQNLHFVSPSLRL